LVSVLADHFTIKKAASNEVVNQGQLILLRFWRPGAHDGAGSGRATGQAA
jgi:hypothetical protein